MDFKSSAIPSWGQFVVATIVLVLAVVWRIHDKGSTLFSPDSWRDLSVFLPASFVAILMVVAAVLNYKAHRAPTKTAPTVAAEKIALDYRIQGVGRYMNGDEYKNLPGWKRELFDRQMQHMKGYSEALGARIANVPLLRPAESVQQETKLPPSLRERTIAMCDDLNRFVSQYGPAPELEPQQASETTDHFVERTTKFYAGKMKMGADFRLRFGDSIQKLRDEIQVRCGTYSSALDAAVNGVGGQLCDSSLVERLHDQLWMLASKMNN